MKNKAMLFTSIIILSSAALTGSPSLYAQQSYEDTIKFRQSGYMFMRWNMGEIKKQVIKNPATYNKEEVLNASNVISAIANSGIEKLFTKETATGKGWHKTRVKSGFFENPDDVKKYASKFTLEARELVNTAHTGDIIQIKKQFKKLLGACKACHKDFRAK